MTETPTPPSPKKKSDLIPRLVTSVIVVPLLLWLMFWGPPVGFAILIGAAVVVGTWEYMSMVMGGENRIAQVVTCACALGVTALIYLRSSPTQAPDGFELMLALTGSGLVLFVTYLFTFKDITKVSLHVGSSSLALIYCGLMPAMLASTL